MTGVKRENEDTASSLSSKKRQKTALPPVQIRYAALFSNTIRIKLKRPGCDGTATHDVHEKLLERQSPLLAKRLAEQDYTLDDVSEEVFGAFVTWLYTGRLIPPTAHAPAPVAKPIHEVEEAVEEEPFGDVLAAELWCFARKYNVRVLKNDCVTLLTARNEKLNVVSDIAAIKLVLERYGPKAGMSRFLVDESAQQYTSPEFVPDLEEMPTSYLAAVIRATARNIEMGQLGTALPGTGPRDACRYHDHAGDMKEKAACRKKLNAMPVFLH